MNDEVICAEQVAVRKAGDPLRNAPPPNSSSRVPADGLWAGRYGGVQGRQVELRHCPTVAPVLGVRLASPPPSRADDLGEGVEAGCSHQSARANVDQVTPTGEPGIQPLKKKHPFLSHMT
ncbi:hypothetical protein SKAU_G00262230 [Synaphobranchus kaupii]|uniref:Uncharacterized protein n=1 Tax=Synaphobranchus kaupii TaxID=118154 RepID=A0A9Q1EYI4_SYNKA|nr:hypothetical protein SKAU_G00262230 [Synaphobranchus kaupii]